MKKLVVISAAFMLSIALVVVQAEASADNSISPSGNSKIIHSDKAKTSVVAKHKKQKKNQLKSHIAPSFTGEQAKANTLSGIHAVKIFTADIIPGILNLGKSEALFKDNACTFILKTRK